MNGLFNPLIGISEFNQLRQGLKENKNQQMVFGVTSTSRDYIMSGLSAYNNEVTLVIAPGENEAGEIAENLRTFLDCPVYNFPALEILPFQIFAQDKEILRNRIRVLNILQSQDNNNKVIVASTEALMRRLCPKEVFAKAYINLEVGQTQQPSDLLEKLISIGYERVDRVEYAGQVSLRGGILDIYPTDSDVCDMPVRMEFFDDEIDSIRLFDVNTQRSQDKIKRIAIGSAQELVISHDGWKRAQESLLNQYQTQIRKLSRNAQPEIVRQLQESMEDVFEYINNRLYFSGIEQFLPYFYPQVVSLLDYLPENALILIDEPERCKNICESVQKERAETYLQLIARGKALPSQYHTYLDWKYLEHLIRKFRVVYFGLLPRQPKFIRPKTVVNLTSKKIPNYMSKIDNLVKEISHWRRMGYVIIIMVSDQEQAKVILDELRNSNLDAIYVHSVNLEVKAGNIIITNGHISSGFDLINARLAIISEKDIYGQVKKQRRQARTHQKKDFMFIESYADIAIGDYVVHVNHGIGKYMGIVPLDIAGIRKEYLLIKYAGKDKLYVPYDQVGLLQKYLSAEAGVPKLSRLGGSEWAKAKSRVKQAVREMADDLIKLYAKRETMKGFAFSRDSLWQKEFEAGFPFEETPDQLKAIEDVKRDMERQRSMDRLLCGDVGYGKTEVALRAAFKAVMDGKQVAVLVPTTILAQQHYNTFRERFSGYPTRIEMLSRFRTPKEQKQVINDLSKGLVDVVIGTHRLVQNDIKFRDLGLVVVDEEQRFGVAHKEKLKQIKANVDVLTLTATPIPRTLHMSLVGVRDTSILGTPPENRYPVQTYVLEEDPVMIQEAIRREIGRGGQVYFVHNRVMDLNVVASWLKELVPEARFVIAHGQMREHELEQVMIEFMEGNYDVLVCTTIIESGLDISNVNTLIVKEANNFGLAQLYQLRGRVGRSKRVAYAYFTFRKDKILNEVAEKRLSAIREFTEFGSGYKIALRDLEIRGAGNLLGAEQHGFIATVGFDLYCQLLKEAVDEVRGEIVERPVDTVVEIPVEAFIPDHYISDANQKVEIYRRIARNNGEGEIEGIEEELVDRFGDLPDPVQNLIGIARLKNFASKLNIKTISKQQGYYKFQFASAHSLNGESLVQIGNSYAGRIKYNNSEEGFEIRLRLNDTGKLPQQILENLHGFLKKLA